MAFASPPQLVDEDLGGCTLGGESGESGTGDPFLIGFNVYRVEDAGRLPTPAELGAMGNWLDFAPFDPALPRDGLLSRVLDPDGIAHSGDESLIYHDAPFTPDGSPRPIGAAPDASGATSYWYAVAPVFAGDLAEWADWSLANGAPRDHRVDLDGDGQFDGVDVHASDDNGPEFVSPQAEAGWEGLGLTVQGRPLLSQLVHVGPESPDCRLRPRGSLSADCIPVGDSVVIDASGTEAACSDVEYRFEAPFGTVLRGWSPDPFFAWTPPGAGSHAIFVAARCPTEPACATAALAGELTVGSCSSFEFSSSLSVAVEGECALRVSWAPAIHDEPVVYDVHRGPAGAPVVLDMSTLVASGLAETTSLDVGWNGLVSYRVVARSDPDFVANAGGDSSSRSALDLTPPSFEGVIDAIDNGYCEVEVIWDESTAFDACSGAASFNLYRDHGVGNAGDTLVASGLTGSSYLDTTPGNGTWVYVVRAVDAAGLEEQNEVFVQESENSCTNDFPEDAGMSGENGIDPPNGDAGAPPPGTVSSGERIFVSRGDDPRPATQGEVLISWSPSPSEAGPYRITYSVMRGSLDTLRSGRYDHALVDAQACGIEAHEYLTTAEGPTASYWIVVPVGGDNATFGYDSSGRERPAAPACF